MLHEDRSHPIAKACALRHKIATMTTTPAETMRVTINDVSRLAGVSIKTVSRVLNKERYVSDETRQKVEAAAAQLGYRPSFAARALAGAKSFQIALIYDNPNPYYAQSLQAGVRARCAEAGYRMIAQPSDADHPDVVNEIMSLIDQAQLDGVILTPPFTEHRAVCDALIARGVPLAAVSPAVPHAHMAAAFIDQEAAARDMTANLITMGHRRIGFIKGPDRFATSARRLAGYCAALEAANIAYDPALVAEGQYDFASGSQAADSLLALANPPSAIFASSDDMAAGVLAAAHQRGIALPGGLSVAGFDDTDLASVVWPPLTTIRQPVRELGYCATQLLLSGTIEHRQLDHQLIERASVVRI